MATAATPSRCTGRPRVASTSSTTSAGARPTSRSSSGGSATTPFVGDFDGDGTDGIGLHRESTGLVFFRNKPSAGWADSEFVYGRAGDKLIAGDWNGDGKDTVAVYRPSNGMLYIKNKNAAGNADAQVWIGPIDGLASMAR